MMLDPDSFIHLYGQDDQQCTANVLAGENRAEVVHILSLSFELDLLTHFGEFSLDDLGASVFVEIVHDLLGFIMSFLHCH